MINFFKSIFGQKFSANKYANLVVNYSNHVLKSNGFGVRYKFYYRNGEIALFEFLNEPSQFYPSDNGYITKILSMKIEKDGYLIGISKNQANTRYNYYIESMFDLMCCQDQFYIFNHNHKDNLIFINIDALRKIFRMYEETDKRIDISPRVLELLSEFILIQPTYAILYKENANLDYKLYNDWSKTDVNGENGLGGYIVRERYGKSRRYFKPELIKRPAIEDLKAQKIESGSSKKDFILEELKSFLDKELSSEMRARLERTIDDYTFETEEAKRQREVTMNDMKASVLIDTVRNKYLGKKEDDAHG